MFPAWKDNRLTEHRDERTGELDPLQQSFLRSPHPHATIKSINTRRAEEVEGVKAIITYEMVPDWKFGNPPILLKMAGDELNGVIVHGAKMMADTALPDSDPQKAVIVDFNQRYLAKTGRPVGNEAASSFDSIHVLANALKVSGPDSVKLRDAIENTKNFVGLTGTFSFSPDDHELMDKNCYALYEIKNM